MEKPISEEPTGILLSELQIRWRKTFVVLIQTKTLYETMLKNDSLNLNENLRKIMQKIITEIDSLIAT